MAESVNSGTAPPDGGDDCSRSMNKCLKRRKKYRRKLPGNNSRTYTSPFPRVQLPYLFSGIPNHDTSKYVEFALSYFNEKNRAQQDPEYELVDSAPSIILNSRPIIYHFNFIARPKNQSNAKDELFFAEVRYARKEDGTLSLFCRCCCILGPPGTETGLGGCNLCCKRHPGVVQHPEGGFSKDTEIWRPWITN